MLCTVVSGAVIYVDDDAAGGGNGQRWATAYKYLQDALYEPPSIGDEIWVAAGTYKPDQDEGGNVTPGLRSETFELINDVTIYGGFAGYGASDPNERDIELYETILSGDLDANDTPGLDPCDLWDDPNRGENSYHVVTGSGTDETAVLNGFTITAGNTFSDSGGGMYNYTGSPTVTNCTFIGNLSSGGGGMCNVEGSNPPVTNCTFIGNSADDSGGGMYNSDNSSPTLTNCMFTGNSAGRGGGMRNWNDSNPTVNNCTFIGNSASYGGGMCNWDSSSPVVTNCTFSRNTASGYGGGMCNFDNISPVVTNCMLWSNSALSGPEIFDDLTSSTTVSYSDIQGGWGGAGSNNINSVPLFVDPNGLDGIIGTEDDNLRLKHSSPCIDAGDNTPVTEPNDLDGRPRIVDGDCDTAATVDMGAYEFSWVYIGDFEGDDCDVDFGDFSVLALNFGQDNPAIDIAPFLDPDGIIDFKELLVLAQHWLAGK